MTSERNVAYARSTIHMPGFPVGIVALVDLDSVYVQERLDAGHLVIVEVVAPERMPGSDAP